MRKALPWIYLLLAVLGAILPWKANLEFIAEGVDRLSIWRGSSLMPTAQLPHAP